MLINTYEFYIFGKDLFSDNFIDTNMPLNVVVIDDEKPAVEILSKFVRKLSFLNLMLGTTNAFEGMEILSREQVDILLIDIEMPDISGLELVKSLKRKPFIIFTTAYKEYALDGYDLDIVDYLLKPIRFDRFLKAINKSNRLHSLVNNSKPQSDYILIKSEYKTVRLNVDHILYIEGCKDYVKIFTTDEMILTRLNLKNIQSKLNENDFLRIHRSFIVSFSKISSFLKNEVEIKGKIIPVGDFYKQELIKRLS